MFEIGDVILVERCLPMFAGRYYEARILRMIVNDDHTCFKAYFVEPIHGILKRPRWVQDHWIIGKVEEPREKLRLVRR